MLSCYRLIGYKAITISTIVDWNIRSMYGSVGYKAITISTIVDFK